MNSLGLGIDIFCESSYVGSEEFARMSVSQNISAYFVLLSEHGECFFIDAPACFCFFERLDSHRLEEEFLELERGGEIDDCITSLRGYF